MCLEQGSQKGTWLIRCSEKAQRKRGERVICLRFVTVAQPNGWAHCCAFSCYMTLIRRTASRC